MVIRRPTSLNDASPAAEEEESRRNHRRKRGSPSFRLGQL
jgi:hypothetical protein